MHSTENPSKSKTWTQSNATEPEGAGGMLVAWRLQDREKLVPYGQESLAVLEGAVCTARSPGGRPA